MIINSNDINYLFDFLQLFVQSNWKRKYFVLWEGRLFYYQVKKYLQLLYRSLPSHPLSFIRIIWVCRDRGCSSFQLFYYQLKKITCLNTKFSHRSLSSLPLTLIRIIGVLWDRGCSSILRTFSRLRGGYILIVPYPLASIGTQNPLYI